MTKWSKLRIIIAVVAIVLVIIIPVYAAYNVQNGNVSNGDFIDVATDGFEEAPDDDVDVVTPVDNDQQKTGERVGVLTTIPISGYHVIEEVVRPVEKWVPENPATDQKLFANNLVAEGSTNILIMGIDKEARLDDAMGIVSIDTKGKKIKLIMFPRDTWIEYSEEVKDAIKKTRMEKEAGWFKLNNIYKVGNTTEKFLELTYNNDKFKETGFDFLSQVIYEKFDIVVDEYVRININGFVKLVDLFKGVTVYVPTYMRYEDPDQGLSINLSKGEHHLNGKQAEGFVRFRQGYDSSGKINIYQDRTKNQIAFLKAFYEQHAKLSNVTKIPEFLTLLNKNVEHSFDLGEILTTYMVLLNEVIAEEYELETFQFKTDDRKVSGVSYSFIKYEEETAETED